MSVIPISKQVAALDLAGFGNAEVLDLTVPETHSAKDYLDLAEKASPHCYSLLEMFTNQQAIYNLICAYLPFKALHNLACSSSRCYAIVNRFNPKGRLAAICAFAEETIRKNRYLFRRIAFDDPKLFLKYLWQHFPETDLFRLSNAVSRIENKKCFYLMTKLVKHSIDKVKKIRENLDRRHFGSSWPDEDFLIPQELEKLAKKKTRLENPVIQSAIISCLEPFKLEELNRKAFDQFVLPMLPFEFAKLSAVDIHFLQTCSDRMISDLSPLCATVHSFNKERGEVLQEEANRKHPEYKVDAPAPAPIVPAVAPVVAIDTVSPYWKYATTICVCIIAALFFRRI